MKNNKKENAKIIATIIIVSFIWIIIICIGLIIINERRKSLDAVESIEDAYNYVNEYVNTIKYYQLYGFGDVEDEVIRDYLDELKFWVTCIDIEYGDANKSTREAIDDFIYDETLQSTWWDYRQYLEDNFYLTEDTDTALNKILTQ